MNKSMIKKYAKLLLKTGVNLKKNDELYIAFDINGTALSSELAVQAYKLGAKRVELIFSDDQAKLAAFKYAKKEDICEFPQWYIDRTNAMVDNKACYIAILSDDPGIFENVDSQLLADYNNAKHKAMKRYYDAATSNEIRWCLCAVPNKNWAKKMFPNAKPSEAVNNLWNYIFKTMRLDTPNAIKAWDEHIKNLEVRSKYLTENKFKAFHITNSLGTDLTVGMPKGYYFSGGNELSKDGISFTANMPTEEVFSLPDRNNVNGIVYSAMPLAHNGKLVEEFYLKLENGKIIEYDAKKGKDVLKGIIESDEGSHYLGEIAFVQFDSPIRNLNTLFYETLFDENASCHLAIGDAYPMISGIENMSEEEIKKAGVNESCVHVDFMYGTKDLSIVGIKEDGQEVTIFKDGNFAF